jgi:hypothetical protein
MRKKAGPSSRWRGHLRGIAPAAGRRYTIRGRAAECTVGAVWAAGKSLIPLPDHMLNNPVDFTMRAAENTAAFLSNPVAVTAAAYGALKGATAESVISAAGFAGKMAKKAIPFVAGFLAVQASYQYWDQKTSAEVMRQVLMTPPTRKVIAVAAGIGAFVVASYLGIKFPRHSIAIGITAGVFWTIIASMRGQWHKPKFWLLLLVFAAVHTAVMSSLEWQITISGFSAIFLSVIECSIIGLSIATFLGANGKFEDFID